MLLTNKIYEGNLFMRYSKHLTYAERMFLRARLNRVRHITLDPKGPGVVRIHMIPPHSQSPEDPYLLLLNGAQLVPLNFSWAVLLSEFMYCMEPYAGVEISADDWESMLEQAVRAVKKKVYPFVKAQILREAGCREAQGFLFSKPLPLEAYEALVYGQ